MYKSIFTRRLLYNVLFLLVMFTYLTYNVEGFFRSEMFRLVAQGHRLSNSLIYEKEGHSVMDCAQLCLSERPLCKSMNYEKQEKLHGGRRFKCQLNNKTKAMDLKDLVPDFAFNYFEPVKLEYSVKQKERDQMVCIQLTLMVLEPSK